jgi:hypothetical protein
MFVSFRLRVLAIKTCLAETKFRSIGQHVVKIWYLVGSGDYY